MILLIRNNTHKLRSTFSDIINNFEELVEDCRHLSDYEPMTEIKVISYFKDDVLREAFELYSMHGDK